VASSSPSGLAPVISATDDGPRTWQVRGPPSVGFYTSRSCNAVARDAT
jgi:hypothetical protein